MRVFLSTSAGVNSEWPGRPTLWAIRVLLKAFTSRRAVCALPSSRCPLVQLKKCSTFRENRMFSNLDSHDKLSKREQQFGPTLCQPPFQIHLGTSPVNSSQFSSPLIGSQISLAPGVCGDVQVGRVSTRWHFQSPAARDTRGSSAQLCPAQPSSAQLGPAQPSSAQLSPARPSSAQPCSFLPAQRVAPGHIINPGVPWDHVLHSRV